MDKICTSIEQSKKLAEILPLESADMVYHSVENEYGSGAFVATSKVITNGLENDDFYIDDIPCWSIAALLDVLESEIDGEDGETYLLNIEKDGTWCNVWYREQYDEANPIETKSTEELIDACYEMILKLNELNLL